MNNLIKTFIGFALLWIVACQKDNSQNDVNNSEKPQSQVIELTEPYEGERAGLAPFFNLSVLVMDSTNVTTNATQVLFNGSLIDSIIAPLSGEQGAIYLNVAYNHYSSLRIKYKNGTEYIHNKPIYITYGTYSNIELKGPFTNWSSLAANFPFKEQRYIRTTNWEASRLPLMGINWRLYTYEIKDSLTYRVKLLPKTKDYRLYRFF